METKQKSRLAILLAALLASSALASCGDSGTPAVTTSAPDNTKTDTTTVTETGPVYKKPDKDFSGQNLNILIWTDSRFPVEEETGDVINDAVFERNLTVQDTLGVTFTYDIRPGLVSDYPEWLNVLNASILAGDDSYQLAGGYGYRLAKDSLGGNFHNLKTNPYIDFTNPWWPSNIIEAADLGGQMTLCFGNIDPTYYDVTYAMYFNKKLAEDLNTGDIYGLVNDGKWTLDKMAELSETAAADLNGDTVMDKNDRFGISSDMWMCVDGYIQSCDIKITERDSDGMPKLLGLTERYADAQVKIRALLNNKNIAFFGSSPDAKELFQNSQSLFLANNIEAAHILRSMKDDFGIIPYPKFNEAQEKYITYNAIGDSTAFVIPITADEELSGAVLEALAYYGWKNLLPAYYDRALKGKAARDTDSEAMLDMIFANIEFDFTQIYSYNFGDEKSPSMAMRKSVNTNSDISSLWASMEKLYADTMDSLVDELK